MNIFDGLQKYSNAKWEVSNSRKFYPEEIAVVNRASVVSSQYGLSVCFMMKAGGNTYIPLSNTSNLKAGDNVDISKAELLTLSREGNDDINRIQI